MVGMIVNLALKGEPSSSKLAFCLLYSCQVVCVLVDTTLPKHEKQLHQL